MQMGFTQEQAEGFACLAKQKEDADKKAFETFKADVQAKIDAKDEALRKDLATKGDLKETESAQMADWHRFCHCQCHGCRIRNYDYCHGQGISPAGILK